MTINSWDNSDMRAQPGPESVDQQPAANEGLYVDSEEQEYTEIDEDELLNQVEDGNPRAEDLATVKHSTLDAGSNRDIYDVPEERATVDTDMNSPVQARSESAENHTEMPTTLSRQPRSKEPKPKDNNRDATWRPYDAIQKGNRKAIRRPPAARDQSMELSAEQWPGSGLSEPIGEHTEQETPQLADEPDAPERIPMRVSLAADSQDIAPETAMHPVFEQTSAFGDQLQNSTG
ncbi:uncharacterized protein BDV17DRAFT_296713 [Aspergillus undulatus]|uniref:uncharacterized protein n=1 Tax=Aspergillus undulatus TaxID=1810928 RepID=UPI003CCD1B29